MRKQKIIISLLSLFFVGVIFPSCSKTVVKEGTVYTGGHTVSKERKFKIALKVYKDPEIDYSAFKSFRLEFKASDQFNPLLDKHLRSLIRENMVKRGFVEDNENPDFIVMGLHKNIFVPDRDPGIKSETGSFSGFAGGQYFHGDYHSGDGLVTAIIKAKKAQRYWIHEFGIVFFNPQTKQVIWIGNANAYVRVDDIRETAPDIIKALLTNYPEPKTGKEPKD